MTRLDRLNGNTYDPGIGEPHASEPDTSALWEDPAIAEARRRELEAESTPTLADPERLRQLEEAAESLSLPVHDAGLSAEDVRSTAITGKPPQGNPETTPQIDALPLPEPDLQRLREAHGGVYGPEFQSQVRETLAALTGLSPEQQAHALEPVAAAPTSTASVLVHQIVTSAAWAAMSPAERAATCEIISACGPTGLADLEGLCREPQRALDRNGQGRSTVEELGRLATTPLHARLREVGVDRRALLDSALCEAARPAANIDQSMFGTCTVTSMQYELARDNPAEYLRIVTDLATHGRAPLRGGGQFELQQEYVTPKPGDSRSPSEILFQGAAMDFGNGNDPYDAANDRSTGGFLFFNRGYEGLNGNQQVRVLEGLYGVDYREWDEGSRGGFDQQLAWLRRYDPTAPGNPPVLLNLEVITNDGSRGQHAVTFLRVEGDRVFLRNPWGSSHDPVGTTRRDGMRLEDPATGVYSMSLEDFRRNLERLVVPNNRG